MPFLHMNVGSPPARSGKASSKPRKPSKPLTEGKLGPKKALDEAENCVRRVSSARQRGPGCPHNHAVHDLGNVHDLPGRPEGLMLAMHVAVCVHGKVVDELADVAG